MRAGALVIGLLSALGASSMDAQTVRGRLIGPIAEPVSPGVLLELIDSSSRVVTRALSQAEGRFQLRAPVGGLYRVRALRIGFRPSLSDLVALTAGEYTDVELPLETTPVVLNAVDVVEKQVCDNRNVGRETAAAWSEALKALALSELTASSRSYQVRLALYERELDRNGNVVSEVSSEREGTSVQPFKAAPADSLARHGYVSIDGANSTYHGPDIQVLLSESFASTHCRYLTGHSDTASRSAWIGIAFKPIEETRPDIEGVLWLDRRTNELREVEFRYVFLPAGLEASGPGGNVTFLKLPSGAWLVSRWRIRMPRALVTNIIRQSGTTTRMSVVSIHETGGEVLLVRSRDSTLWTGRSSAIRGQITMESGESPGGVQLRVENTNRRAATDSVGRFSFEVLRPGTHTVIVATPHLRALGEADLRVPVVVRDSSIAEPRIVVPSQAAIITRVCGAGSITDSLGLIRVIVSDSLQRVPTGRVAVSASWHQSLVRQGKSVAATRGERRGEQVSAGVFWLCAIPKERWIEVVVRQGARTTKTQTRLSAGDVFADHEVTP